MLALSAFKTHRIIRDLPASKVRSIAMGLVEVHGTAEPFNNYLYKSPFTQTNCLYYKCTVEEYTKNQTKGRPRTWKTIKTKESKDFFYLKDATGQVLIDAKKAGISISSSYELESSILKDIPSNIKDFLDKNNILSGESLDINKKMRFKEYLIKQGDELFILGSAMDNKKQKEGSAVQGYKDIMISKDKIRKVFIISNSSEKSFLSGLKVSGWILAATGTVMLLFAVWPVIAD